MRKYLLLVLNHIMAFLDFYCLFGSDYAVRSEYGDSVIREFSADLFLNLLLFKHFADFFLNRLCIDLTVSSGMSLCRILSSTSSVRYERLIIPRSMVRSAWPTRYSPELPQCESRWVHWQGGQTVAPRRTTLWHPRELFSQHGASRARSVQACHR